jgi:L-amino acid N-acyltransferase YncA
MKIVKFKKIHSSDVLNWRNDKFTRDMSFNKNKISNEEHQIWTTSLLKNKNKIGYICILNKENIGICYFDIDIEQSRALVSINLNPKYRGQGLSKNFLSLAITKFKRKYFDIDLLAHIKLKNKLSKKIFIELGFKILSKNKNSSLFILYNSIYKFKKVSSDDSSLLYNLLKKRKFKISHQNLPSLKLHLSFIKSNPYRFWYLIYYKNLPIGTFYIQNDNSIGLNIIDPSNKLIKKSILYIKQHFKPKPPIASKVPPYFYFNASFEDLKLIRLFKFNDLIPLQISFKMENNY